MPDPYIPQQIDKRFDGSIADEGVILLGLAGDRTVNPVTGERDAAPYVFVGDLDKFTAKATIADTATVQIEGNITNPTIEADWFQVGELTETGIKTFEEHILWLRARVSAHSDGQVTVTIAGRG